MCGMALSGKSQNHTFPGCTTPYFSSFPVAVKSHRRHRTGTGSCHPATWAMSLCGEHPASHLPRRSSQPSPTSHQAVSRVEQSRLLIDVPLPSPANICLLNRWLILLFDNERAVPQCGCPLNVFSVQITLRRNVDSIRHESDITTCLLQTAECNVVFKEQYLI